MLMNTDQSSSKSQSMDDLLVEMTGRIPYSQFLGIEFMHHGDELTSRLNFSQQLIGNPDGPYMHGGVTAAFLEITALVELTWRMHLEGGKFRQTLRSTKLPKTISFSIDYLRPGKTESAFARAEVTRSGRRFATLHVVGWQNESSRLFAQATGHFQLPTSYE